MLTQLTPAREEDKRQQNTEKNLQWTEIKWTHQIEWKTVAVKCA